MVSYAPKGGSVGKHFDFMMCFSSGAWSSSLAARSNVRCKYCICTQSTIKTLPEIDVQFDEVLAPGDLLYVPPGMAHYGVAEDDCLTFSFGFRMPNVAGMMERISDQFSANILLQNPVVDIARKQMSQIGEINSTELSYLKDLVLAQLQDSTALDAAIMSYMSEPKYPDNIPEPDEIEADDLQEILHEGYEVLLEPASRLLYTESDGILSFWGNGGALCIAETFASKLKAIADGESLAFDSEFNELETLENVAYLLNESILMLLPPSE